MVNIFVFAKFSLFCYKFLMIASNHLRAARAMLGWTLEELAERSGISTVTLATLENGKEGRKSTFDKLVSVYMREGLELNGRGVVQSDPIIYLDGEGWYLDLLEDVSWTLREARNKECLVFYADEGRSSESVRAKLRGMALQGVTQRMLVEQGNTSYFWDLSQYRCVPSAMFKNWVTLVYGDKVAVSVASEKGCRIVRDRDLAQVERLKFELLWSLLPPPEGANA